MGGSVEWGIAGDDCLLPSAAVMHEERLTSCVCPGAQPALCSQLLQCPSFDSVLQIQGVKGNGLPKL